MPSKTAKQHKFMAAIAHSPEFAKKAGVPQSVGKDFTKADKGLKFRKGGTSSSAVAGINKQQTHHGKMQLPNVSLNKYMGKKEGGMATSKLFKGKETYKEELKEAKAIKSGKISPTQYARGEESEKKMAKGGLAGGHKSADGIAIRGKTRAMAPAMRKGGKC